MHASPEARPEYVAALGELIARIASTLPTTRAANPLRMIIAGGAAMHLYTGVRVSKDVDAVFSHRIALPENLSVAYRGADGRAQVLYFDYQYSDTLGLLHEDAHDDAVHMTLPGINAKVLDVRLLAPVDLAISKLSRFVEVDRGDIEALARKGLVKSRTLRHRAEEALSGAIGDLARLRGSIDIACRLVADVERQHKGA
jgi:Nucleotidyltransferase of unknown function (DUF6036)